jgi:hypothetical protein
LVALRVAAQPNQMYAKRVVLVPVAVMDLLVLTVVNSMEVA